MPAWAIVVGVNFGHLAMPEVLSRGCVRRGLQDPDVVHLEHASSAELVPQGCQNRGDFQGTP